MVPFFAEEITDKQITVQQFCGTVLRYLYTSAELATSTSLNPLVGQLADKEKRVHAASWWRKLAAASKDAGILCRICEEGILYSFPNLFGGPPASTSPPSTTEFLWIHPAVPNLTHVDDADGEGGCSVATEQDYVPSVPPAKRHKAASSLCSELTQTSDAASFTGRESTAVGSEAAKADLSQTGSLGEQEESLTTSEPADVVSMISAPASSDPAPAAAAAPLGSNAAANLLASGSCTDLKASPSLASQQEDVEMQDADHIPSELDRLKQAQAEGTATNDDINRLVTLLCASVSTAEGARDEALSKVERVQATARTQVAKAVAKAREQCVRSDTLADRLTR